MFSTGADMNNAYAWYGDGTRRERERSDKANGGGAADRRRPSQRRRLLVDRQTFDFYHFLIGYPKVDRRRGLGLRPGRGLRARPDGGHRRRGERRAHRDARRPGSSARPSARSTCSSTGSARCSPGRLLLTGDTMPASTWPTSACSPRSSTRAAVEARAAWWAREDLTHAGRRDRHGQGGVPAGRAAAGLPGRRGAQLPVPLPMAPTSGSRRGNSTS